MAFTERMATRTYVTGSAVSQFRFVTFDANGRVNHTATLGARADGVSLGSSAGTGEVIAVAYDGRVLVTAAGNITRGAAVTSNASGQAVAATTGNVILGTATEAAVSGQVITIELRRDGNAA